MNLLHLRGCEDDRCDRHRALAGRRIATTYRRLLRSAVYSALVWVFLLGMASHACLPIPTKEAGVLPIAPCPAGTSWTWTVPSLRQLLAAIFSFGRGGWGRGEDPDPYYHMKEITWVSIADPKLGMTPAEKEKPKQVEDRIVNRFPSITVGDPMPFKGQPIVDWQLAVYRSGRAVIVGDSEKFRTEFWTWMPACKEVHIRYAEFHIRTPLSDRQDDWAAWYRGRNWPDPLQLESPMMLYYSETPTEFGQVLSWTYYVDTSTLETETVSIVFPSGGRPSNNYTFHDEGGWTITLQPNGRVRVLVSDETLFSAEGRAFWEQLAATRPPCP